MQFWHVWLCILGKKEKTDQAWHCKNIALLVTEFMKQPYSKED